MNTLNFGLDGPQITGWWYNPKTGDKFNAVDMYFEDNNLLIKTADSRIINYNQIQNYVQVEDPKQIPEKPTNKTHQEEIPPEVLAEIDNGDIDNILIPEDNIYNGLVKRNPESSYELGNIYNEPEQSQSPVIQNITIIDRALSNKELPKLSGAIEWKYFPKREIEMLIDIMQIPEQEIVQYYINNISLEALKDMVSCSIEQYMKDMLQPDNCTTLDKSVDETEAQSTTHTQKKTKNKTNKE